jgi:hypothetical protein
MEIPKHRVRRKKASQGILLRRRALAAMARPA